MWAVPSQNGDLTILRGTRIYPRGRHTVRIARTILAALISVSVAAMPAAARGISVAKSDASAVADTASAAGMPHGCEHHAAPGDHGSKPADDGGSMAAGCASCCTYVAAEPPSLALAPTHATLAPISAAFAVVCAIGSLPFRPPRI